MGLMHFFDAAAVWIARILAILALLAGGIFAAAYLLDNILHRAGYGGALIDFFFAEHRREKWKLWARLVWGRKPMPESSGYREPDASPLLVATPYDGGAGGECPGCGAPVGKRHGLHCVVND